MNEERFAGKWHLASKDAVGVVITVHGLNNKPEVMAPFGESLSASGFHVFELGLSGHLPEQSLAAISEERWLRDFGDAVDECRHRFPALPLHILAYSLGALVAAVFLDAQTENAISAAYFLAPALQFTTWGKIRRLLSPLRFLRVALPSVAPRHLRQHRTTPLRAYWALLMLASRLQNIRQGSALRSIPVRYVLSPDDRVISERKTDRWISRNGLRSWQRSDPLREFRESRRIGHYLIDPQVVGSCGWTALTSDIAGFFAPHRNPARPQKRPPG